MTSRGQGSDRVRVGFRFHVRLPDHKGVRGRVISVRDERNTLYLCGVAVRDAETHAATAAGTAADTLPHSLPR